MDEEDVWVEVFHIAGETYGARVRCEFVFSNPGPARILLMGFPTRLSTEELDDPSRRHPEVRDFKAILDGVPLKVSLETAAAPPEGAPPLRVAEWATFEAAFGAGQTRRLVHTYEVTLPGDSTGESAAGYVLTTGAMWAEPIGRARVEFAMGPVRPWHLTSMFPASFLFSGDNAWVWEARNIRPEYDLRITFRMRCWADDPAKVTPPEQWTAEWRAEFEEVDRKASNHTWLLDRYRSVRERCRMALLNDPYNVPNTLPVLWSYAASRLPPESVPPPAAPQITAMSALPQAEPGTWMAAVTATDLDCDLRFLMMEVFTGEDGSRTVHFSQEWRETAPWPRATYTLTDLTRLPVVAGMMLRATSSDAAGNSTVSEPVPIQLPSSWLPPPVEPNPRTNRSGLLVGAVVLITAAAAAVTLRRRRFRGRK
jgi:hypothetical protein